MDESIYDWQRFWSRRDGEIDLSDDGFLVDPNSQYAECSRSSAVDFKSIAHFAALGLLGEPGIGKSTGLKREYRLAVEEIGRAGDRSLWFDLAAYGSDTLLCDRVFKSPQFLAWERGEGRLYLFLDSLDDGLLRIRNLPALLIDTFQTLPVDRLSIRIACRTADWPSTLESGLPRLWRAVNVGIFEMLPLRRDDAAQMVTWEKVDSRLFFDAIEHAGAGPFANRPITLRALLKKFKRNEALSDRQADLYLDLCRILCEEHSEHRIDASNVGHVSAAQRLVIASRFASAVVFGARAGICIGPYRADTPPHDVQLDHLLGREETVADANFEIDRNAARETLGLTGLFSSRGAKRLGFAHQSFAEFLAAHYLFLHKLSTVEILGLLRHPGGSGKIIPQLRETAAWIGSLIPEVLQGILCTDPKSLLQSSVNIADFPARRQLAQAALRLYDSEELVDERIAHDAARRLWHPNLHEDLEPFIRDKTKGITVRRVAIALAALCQPAKLGMQLVEVALDKEDVHAVRVAAAFAISRMDDSAIRAALRPLITHASEEDPADELRGCALSALWPDHLKAAELLAALQPPQRANVFGTYWRFWRSDIAKHIKPEEFTTAFRWAEDCLNGHLAEYPSASIAIGILVRAVDLYNWPEFSEGIPPCQHR